MEHQIRHYLQFMIPQIQITQHLEYYWHNEVLLEYVLVKLELELRVIWLSIPHY